MKMTKSSCELTDPTIITCRYENNLSLEQLDKMDDKDSQSNFHRGRNSSFDLDLAQLSFHHNVRSDESCDDNGKNRNNNSSSISQISKLDLNSNDVPKKKFSTITASPQTSIIIDNSNNKTSTPFITQTELKKSQSAMTNNGHNNNSSPFKTLSSQNNVSVLAPSPALISCCQFGQSNDCRRSGNFDNKNGGIDNVAMEFQDVNLDQPSFRNDQNCQYCCSNDSKNYQKTKLSNIVDDEKKKIIRNSPNEENISHVYIWLNERVPCLGILITLASSILFGISMALVKKCLQLQPTITGIQMSFTRGVVMVLLTGFVCIYKKMTIWIERGERLVNASRAVLGGVACILLYTSMKFITVADASAISFSSPIWTCILSYIIFREPILIMQFISMPASLLGVVIIAHPGLFTFIGLGNDSDIPDPSSVNDNLTRTNMNNASFMANNNSNITVVSSIRNASTTLGHNAISKNHTNDNLALEHWIKDTEVTPPGEGTIISEVEQLQDTQLYGTDDRIYGIILAVLSSLIMASVYIVLKYRKNTPVQVTVFWLALTGSIVSLSIMIPSGSYEWPKTYSAWLCIFGNGLFSWLAQTIFQEAFVFEDAGVISLVRTCDVVVTYILSFFLLHEDIRLSSVIGAIIITLSVISLMANKWLRVKLLAQKLEQQSKYGIDEKPKPIDPISSDIKIQNGNDFQLSVKT